MTEIVKENQPYWKYIIAWILFSVLANLMTLVSGSFIYSFADGDITLNGHRKIIILETFLQLPIYMLSAYLVFAKIFSKLNLYSVFKWLIILGSFFMISRIGNNIQYFEQLGVNHFPYSFFQASIWILFLIFFRVFFRDHKKAIWF